MTDIETLLGTLGRHKVAFIVVGGVAATAHGSARLTQDLDIVYERTASNLERLVAALAPYKPYLRGAPPGLPFLWDRQTLARGLNFTLRTSVGDIETLLGTPGQRQLAFIVVGGVAATAHGSARLTQDPVGR